MNNSLRVAGILSIVGLIVTLAACSGGSSSASSGGSANSQTASVSSGVVTAIGSVFVNGHEFNTANANIVDDDTGVMTAASGVSGTGDLEVGMVVDVKSANGSTHAHPFAAEVHVSPLARGYVDASDATAGTITVMGQTVQLTSATAFSDHRGCVTATSNTCTAIAGQAGLTTSVGSTPGSFVAIHGYLFTTASGSPQIIATLVSALDYNAAGTSPSQFKLEGLVTAATSAVPASVTIGAETVDLSKAKCSPAANCAIAYAVGDVVAASGKTAPATNTFSAERSRLVKLLPQTAGSTVEVEGKVSSISGTSFVIRGINIDGSALATLPKLGDKVEVLGTIAADGTSVIATSLEQDEAAMATRITFAGPLSNVAAGAAADTFVVTVLGQTATVDATTRIADRTALTAPTFNINNFQTYLQGKTAFVVLSTVADASGNLHATGFDIVKAPANAMVAIAGPADGAPTQDTTTKVYTVTVHNVSVNYSSTSISNMMMGNKTITAGSYILAAGALTSGVVDTTVVGGKLVVLPASANPMLGVDRGYIGF